MATLAVPSGFVDLRTGALQGQQPAQLSHRELAVLRYLAQRPHQIVDRHVLQTEVLGLAAAMRTRIVDKVIMTLREKVEADRTDPVCILTVHGEGYKWVPPAWDLLPALRQLEPNAFVGRGAEVEAVLELLQRPHVVTLTGPGGVGKTRLSRQVASRWEVQSGADVYVCDLTLAHGPSELAPMVAAALSVPSGEPEQIGAALAARGATLLVLDNFEHLQGAEALVRQWWRGAAELRILVTSRSALSLDCERVVPIAPLPLDEAVELLCRRAEERGGEVAADDDARQLVQVLEGLPLAVELAASQASMWSAAQAVRMLQSRGLLDLGRAAGGPPRHASLRATLDWSWSLLPVEQRHTLAVLSVFQGGICPELAAEVVQAVLPRGSSLIDIGALCSSSWIQSSSTSRGRRLHLLQHVHRYATERLADAGLVQRAQRAHGECLARLAAARVEEQQGPRAMEARDELLVELGNLRVACTRAIQRGDPEVMAPTGLAAVLVMHHRGMVEAALQLSEGMVETRGAGPEPLAMAWYARACAQLIADPDEARGSFERAARLAQQTDLRDIHVNAVRLVGRLQPTLDEGVRILLRALDAAERPVHEGMIQCELAVMAASREDWHEAHRWLDLAMRHLPQGPPAWRALARSHRAYVYLCQGRLPEAEATYHEAIEQLEQAGDLVNVLVARKCLGMVKAEGQDFEAARALFAELVEPLRRLGSRSRLASVLVHLAHAMVGVGELSRAQELLEESVALQVEPSPEDLQLWRTTQATVRAHQGASIE
ncbi:MAG: winged helix-turn-helix domain-containing protein [Myxococcales bacterium]|nr:winged helix-turn-helix domain-containing protein [Myxococcales bacterium]